jgi:DNA topoisomerase-1
MIGSKHTMGKPLVIVESPAKARTIGRYLGEEYEVQACVGHVRDLPESAAQIPASAKGKPWARLGVNVDDNFKPLYVLTQRGRESVKSLKAALKDAPALYLATDEDREGEAIAWHLFEALKPKVPTHRLVFHEITETAIRAALADPRELDLNLVRAQETRRIIDRLYGYDVSPVLWRKVKPKLSAGRVQSVAVRLVVDRERKRMAFVSAGWWGLSASFQTELGSYEGQLQSIGGTRCAMGRDFDPNTGALKSGSKSEILKETAAKSLEQALSGATGSVLSVEDKGFTEKPSPPYTTSTLQQEANRKLKWSAKRTMSVAQRLYENGWITYMRTDSSSLSKQALSAARALIQADYGEEFLPGSPRTYATKSQGAQEAHEAIRPAGERFKSIGECQGERPSEEARLYELIWKRTVACQMENATGMRRTLDTQVQDAIFRSKGKVYTFPGFRLAYVSDKDEPTSLQDKEVVLPNVAKGDSSDVTGVDAKGHETQPPARLNDATLIKELESKGIGRPSTYASIIDTIERRNYVFKRSTALVPTWTAFAVTKLMESHFASLIDYGFTAQLEDGLDAVARGDQNPQDYLARFYRGSDGWAGLTPLIEATQEAADPKSICTFALGEEDGKVVAARVGKFGPYVEWDGQTRSLPEGLAPDELTAEKAIELIKAEKDGPRILGQDEETGLDVSILVGRFGPYVQLGEMEKGSKKKPKRASLLKGMVPDEVDFETAVALLSLPRNLGTGLDGTGEVLALNGRYGPYIKWGKETRTMTPEMSPLTLTLEEAHVLLKTPSKKSRGTQVLRTLGTDEDDRTIDLKSGRYGPYVTDGKANATLPKDTDTDSVTLEMANEMLEKKRAAPPRKKKKTVRRKKKS